MLETIFCKQLIAHILKHRRFSFFEKSKMLNQKLYNPALDCKLFSERQFCKTMCYKYNNLPPRKIKTRNLILSKILGKVGKTFLVEQPFMCDYGYNIEIGENFCSNHNLIILDPAKVVFGDNVLVGPNCGFYTTTHPLNPILRSKGVQVAKPIIVEDNVWICSNVVVLGGVTIGKNSVIAAGSVVNENIPPNSLVMGNPCKIIKKLSPTNF